MTCNINNNPAVIDFVKKIASDECFLKYDLEYKDATKNGEGYLGVVKLIQITGEDKNRDTIIKNFICKCSFDDDAVREHLGSALIYKNEIFIYNNVFPRFMEFQAEKQLKSHFNKFAKCYATSSENKEECLIMENLKDSGFAMWGKNALVDEQHTILVLQTYARFHALSFAIKDQDGNMWKEISNIPDVHEGLFKKIDFTGQIKKQIGKLEDKLNMDNKLELLKLLQKFKANVGELFENTITTPSDHGIIVHGDSWFNNMMFKYNDKTRPNLPTDIRLLDFQTTRVGSPIIDLSYFICCCTPKEIYNNLDRYLHIYHDTLCCFLNDLGSTKELYTFTALKEDWGNYSLFGFTIAFMVLAAVLVERENLSSFSDISKDGGNFIEDFLEEITNLDEYFVRIEDLVKYFADTKLI